MEATTPATRSVAPTEREIAVVLEDSGRRPFVDNPENVAADVAPHLRDATGAHEED